jgi:RhtB (resistance to homoserine/threonine) family protein
MTLLLSLGAFGVVALLAAMSPGPDFLVVSKNSIGQSRKVGVMTALGVAVGNCVHVSYTVIGIGLIIASSIVLFSAIKIAGAIYLVYLGVHLMTEKSDPDAEAVASAERLTPRAAFKQGFFTNVLNPKATLFFMSVFSQFVSPSLPIAVRTLFGVEAVTVIGLWFVVLAVILTFPAVRTVISHVQKRILKFMGAALLLLGVKVALTSN